MASYTRQSTFADGDTITAALFNDEFNQLVNAFNASTGHKHDGTAGEGPVIDQIGDSGNTPINRVLVDTTNNYIEFWIDVSSTSTQQLYIADGAIVPTTDNDIDLGTSSLEFKDLYIDGTANIDSLVLGSGATVTAILDEDTLSSDSATALATQQSIKAYVDSQVTAQDLDLTSDSGTIAIDLDSETLTVAGGTGIDTSAATNTVTVAIDSTVATLTGTQTLTNKTLTSPVINTGVSGTAVLDDDTFATASSTTIATSESIKAYVDSQVTAQDLDFQGDSGGALSIDLDSETLTIAGGTGIDTSGATNTLTVSIDSTVATLTGTQTLTNKTLTTPVISSISNTGTLTLPTSTDTLVGRATTDTLTNKTLTSPVINTGVSGTAVLDDDTFATASATTLATSESIKAYVDTTVAATNEVVEDTSPQLGGNLDVNGYAITGSTVQINGSTGELMISATENGPVALRYDNNLKLSTKSDGVNITGELECDSLDVDGDADILQDLNVSGTITGTLATAAQTNITSVGTLSSLTTSGNVTVGGDLTVNGTTTTVNTETINLADNIILFNSNATGTPTENAGIEIERGDSTNKTLLWNETDDKWTVGSETFVAGTFEGNLTGNVTGNADTATTLATARDFSLTGDVTAAAVSFDGSGNVALSTSIGSNTVGITELNVTDGTSGQVLTTDGAGTLSFTSTSSYSDSDVETYLDTGTSTPTFASAIVSGDLTVDTNTLYVDSTNNRVGIGTTSPSRDLHIASSVPSIRLEDTDVSGLYNEIVQLSGGDLSFRADHGNVQASTSISFSTDGTEKVRIDSSGKVGIGTASPAYELHIASTTTSTGSVHIDNDEIHTGTGVNSLLSVHTNNASATGTTFFVRQDGTGDIFVAQDQNTEVFVIKDGGKVGVGTASPDMAVTVATAANISQVAITSSSNSVAWDATAAANAYYATTENTTFAAPSNATEGAIISVEIAQGGTPYTVAWNTVFEFAASTAPTVTATANKTDIFTFRYNGSVWQEIGRTQNLAQT
jgi:hypothetical protein